LGDRTNDVFATNTADFFVADAKQSLPVPNGIHFRTRISDVLPAPQVSSVPDCGHWRSQPSQCRAPSSTDGPRSLRHGTKTFGRIVAKSELKETGDEEAGADPSLEKNACEERRVEAGKPL